MVSTIPTHAEAACAVRSFAISKVQFFHLRTSRHCMNPLAIAARIPCGKNGGTLA